MTSQFCSKWTLGRIGAVLSVLSVAASPSVARQVIGNPHAVGSKDQYVLIAWNDLGMHCISPRFSEMAILPPYNTVRAVVIRRAGEEPRIVTGGLTVHYALDGNRTVNGKTDFWTYAYQLFGVKLHTSIGLKGMGLAGDMKLSGDLPGFVAEGIPALPYNDSKDWNPFQRATVYVTQTGKTKALATISIVVPVSDELNCAKCHASGKVAAKKIKTPTVEGNILTLHDQRSKTKLMSARPVLCASCHADNALGMSGNNAALALSAAMHRKHASVSKEPACYDCHPGRQTQCNRSAIEQMGPVGSDPKCDNCHGDLDRMAASLKAGRQPWLEEPTCSQCHGRAYDTKGVLYRNATGHGGVPCIACHGSPHAWWPSTRADDNLLPQTLQGSAKSIGYKACFVCHTDGRTGKMPPHSGD